MGILSWVVFGALAGWAASIITGRNERQGCFLNIVIGIVGAFVGGTLIEFLGGGGDFNFGFDLRSFGVAVLGAVILLLIAGTTRKRR